LTAILAFVVIATRLAGLGDAPPGLFRDEASFGYNGWTIAHFGTDQYGTHWPLLFRSFGDYKGPVGVYLEATLTTFLPLAPWVIRLPNAIAGFVLAFAAGWLAWRLTKSQAVFLILVVEAAFEPWFFHLGRTMLEVDLLTPLCYVVTLALLSGGGEQRLRASIAAGLTLGAACFSAQPGRFFTPVFLLIVLFAFRRSLQGARLVALVAPVVAATAILVASASSTTARLGDVSVFKGHGLFEGLGLGLVDFLHYLGPGLLFLHGDGILRHSTGIEGLFLVISAVPVAIGAVAAFRHRTEPIATIALLAFLMAPAAASLAVGVSARRDVISMPSFLVFLAYGWQVLVPWLRERRGRVGAAVALVVLCAVPYYLDYVLVYPDRAAVDFQTGGLDAVKRANEVAQGHAIFISEDISPDALVVLRPDPRRGDPFMTAGIHLIRSPAEVDLAQPGDILVLTTPDKPPEGATLLFQEVTTGPVALGGSPAEVIVVSVYRR
jgi:4-amino-4-deoxy-L-arabinose transferase-like glycosyltransferase